MTFHELVADRESIRSYDPEKPIKETVLNRILEAGRVAPSAGNHQPWHFLLISSREMLEKVRRCYSREWFQEAPHVLAVLGSVDSAWVRSKDGYNSLETDLTIAMDHMILAAESEGVATCWIADFDRDILYDVLSVADNERIFAITPLGYAKKGFTKMRNKQRKSIEEIVRRL
jgi:nitroreductase